MSWTEEYWLAHGLLAQEFSFCRGSSILKVVDLTSHGRNLANGLT